MRVALDGTPLTVASDGMARYTAELSRALAAGFPEDEFLLFSDQPFPIPGGAPPNLRQGGARRDVPARRWWSWGIQRAMARENIAVFHGTGFSVPYLPLRPSVLSIHDLSPWLQPEWHRAAARIRRRTPYLAGLGLAAMILTDTQAVRRAAIERFRLNPGRVAAVPLAAASLFRPLPQPPPATPYFLYVGTLEPRKNLTLLVEAWRQVARVEDVELWLAGRRREDAPVFQPQPGLRLLGEVPDEALPGLYSGALAFVYPSLYEGFGLPVLEAMACGAAVITSRDPAITEVAGRAAVDVDAGDAKGWVEAMNAAVARPDWVAQLRQRSLGRAGEFSWGRTARLTHDVYEEARRRFGI